MTTICETSKKQFLEVSSMSTANYGSTRARVTSGASYNAAEDMARVDAVCASLQWLEKELN